jgi:hypothetical protein
MTLPRHWQYHSIAMATRHGKFVAMSWHWHGNVKAMPRQCHGNAITNPRSGTQMEREARKWNENGTQN